MAVSRSTFADPYRVRCPEGHANLRPLSGCRMAYCRQCRRSYGFEALVDAKESGVRP